MSDFSLFSHAIKKQFDELSKSELFVTVEGDDVWEQYLASFPEGTNPTFRERTEHDCSCCKHFVRNIGNVVSIKDGKLVSVWNVKGLEHPYAEVAAALAEFVTAKPILRLFRKSETNFGNESTPELLENGQTKRWNHFYSTVSHNHHTKEVDKFVGEYNTTKQVFMRGLEELTEDSFTTVIGLIDDKQLYRGDEFLNALKAFQKLQKDYLNLNAAQRDIYAWENANNPVAKIRNTAIGTLIQDLSKGLELEQAVKKYDAIMAPENYKRSKSLITPKMIEDAMKTIRDNDLEGAEQRRHAKISDISVNNVLWVDNSTKSKMKGGLEGLLMTAATDQVPTDNIKAEDITMDDFMANILPRVTSMEILVKNSQQGNFMSLTAPVHDNCPLLFKWNNNFAWSYNGNIADSSLRDKVQSLGGRVDGVLRFSHMWNHAERNASLMDLHVFMPGSSLHRDGCHDTYPTGQRVGWNNRKDNISGGVQDVDYTDAAPEGYVPVENITFPQLNKLKDGKYTFKIHNWRHRYPTNGGFKAEIEFGGQVFQYEHLEPLANKQWITLAVATLKNGVFTIEHHHPVGVASQEKWGIKTETFVKVNTLMLSPNFWDENKVGNKHWFFILDNCKNDEPTRGFYNEFLNSKLDKHRKVFEVLGDKTKCQPTDEQLSGMGFSSTRSDTVVVKVAGNKLRKIYNITF